jgi:hypothetical protein
MAGRTPETYRLPFSGVGFNHNPNVDEIPPTSLVYPSRNVNLNKNGVEARGGTSKVDSAKYGGAEVMGGRDYELADETQFRVVVTTDGKIWKNTTTTIHTGWTAGRYVHFEVYNFKLYISNGVDVPQVWDGAAGATTDLGSTGETAPTACTGALAGAGAGNVDDGTHSYKITFLNIHGETEGGATSNVVTVADKSADGQIDLTAIPTGPTGITSRKIYRTVAGDAGNHKLVATLSDNTTTTYTDNTADAGLGADVPTTNTAALLPTDWTGPNHPQVLILHGKGNSEALWALGVASKPNIVYASKANDGISEADFSDSQVDTIPVGSGTLTGGIEFGDNLLVWDRLRSYVIDDTNLDRTKWGYAPSQFKSGLADFKLVVKTENDIYCVQEDGTVYSATAVQAYGDYKMASITKPAYIDEWIREYIDLTKINQFHMQYDPTLRCIKIFMVYKGDSSVKMALTYFIDNGPEKGWGPPHDNKDFASGYDATCSFVYRVSAGEYKIYTGDDSGNVWELETANKNDDSNGFSEWARTPRLLFENSRITKRYMKGWLLTRAEGNYSVNIDITVFDSAGNPKVKSITVSLDSGQAVWGAVNWGAFTWADAEAIIDHVYNINRIGKRIQFDFYNNNANEPFFLSSNLTDFRFLGARIG